MPTDFDLVDGIFTEHIFSFEAGRICAEYIFVDRGKPGNGARAAVRVATLMNGRYSTLLKCSKESKELSVYIPARFVLLLRNLLDHATFLQLENGIEIKEQALIAELQSALWKDKEKKKSYKHEI